MKLVLALLLILPAAAATPQALLLEPGTTFVAVEPPAAVNSTSYHNYTLLEIDSMHWPVLALVDVNGTPEVRLFVAQNDADAIHDQLAAMTSSLEADIAAIPTYNDAAMRQQLTTHDTNMKSQASSIKNGLPNVSALETGIQEAKAEAAKDTPPTSNVPTWLLVTLFGVVAAVSPHIRLNRERKPGVSMQENPVDEDLDLDMDPEEE